MRNWNSYRFLDLGKSGGISWLWRIRRLGKQNAEEASDSKWQQKPLQEWQHDSDVVDRKLPAEDTDPGIRREFPATLLTDAYLIGREGGRSCHSWTPVRSNPNPTSQAAKSSKIIPRILRSIALVIISDNTVLLALAFS